MWISRAKYEEMLVEITRLREQVIAARLETQIYVGALANLKQPIPPVVPEPEKTALKPIDEDKTRRIRDLLDSQKGTKWQRAKRAAEKALREQPTEVVINTPATTEK